MNKYWNIEGWESTNLLFKFEIPLGQITQNGMKELLKVLTAKHSLTENEIIGCYAIKRSKIHTNHLEVQCSSTGNRFTMTCGSNPFVVASVVER